MNYCNTGGGAANEFFSTLMWAVRYIKAVF